MSWKENLLRSTLVLLIMLTISAAASAAPALSGSTGMIRVPAADSLKSGQFSIGYYYWKEHGASVAKQCTRFNLQ